MSGQTAEKLFNLAKQTEIKRATSQITKAIKSLHEISTQTLASDTRPEPACIVYCRQNWQMIITAVEKVRLQISAHLLHEAPEVRKMAISEIYNNILLILLATGTYLQPSLNLPSIKSDYTADDTRCFMSTIEKTGHDLIQSIHSLPGDNTKQLESYSLFLIKIWEQQLAEFESKTISTAPLEEAIKALHAIQLNSGRIKKIMESSSIKFDSLESKSYINGEYHVDYTSIEQATAYQTSMPILCGYRDLLLRVEDRAFELKIEINKDRESSKTTTKKQAELQNLQLISAALKIEILETISARENKALGNIIRISFAYDTAGAESTFETDCLNYLSLNKDKLPTMITSDKDLMEEINAVKSLSINEGSLLEGLEKQITEYIPFYKQSYPRYSDALKPKTTKPIAAAAPATPKAATPKVATPKAARPKAATPKAATPKAAKAKAATPKAATPKTLTKKRGAATFVFATNNKASKFDAFFKKRKQQRTMPASDDET